MPKAESGAGERGYTFPNRVRNPFRVMLAMWRVVKDIKNIAEAGIV